MNALDIPAPDWATYHAQYRRLVILRDADAAFGALADATYDREMAIQQAEVRCATRTEALAQRNVRIASRALAEAEERHYAAYGDPLESAAIAAVLAPAPDLDAVEAKMALIRLFEMENHRGVPRRPMEIIETDMARLFAASVVDANSDARPAIGTDQAVVHLANAEHLAKAIGDLVDPGRASPDLLQSELRRAAEALEATP